MSRKNEVLSTSERKALLVFLCLFAALGRVSAHHRRGTTYDDSNSAIVYSQGQNGNGVNGWGQGADAADFGGGEHFSNAYSGSFVVHFSGTDFQWIGKKGPNFGIASLLMDGQSVGTVDAYSPTVLHQQVLYSSSGLADRPHVFQMKIGDYPNPPRNPSSSGWYQVLDGFSTSGTPLTLSMISPQNGAVTRQGAWSFGPNILSGSYCWSNDRSTPGSLTLPFSGSGVEVYGHPEGEDGMMDVYIDGSYVTTVDEFNPYLDSISSDANDDQLIFVKAGLPAGNHSIKLVVSQSKNAKATDYYTQIDGFIVLPGSAAPPPLPPPSGGGALSGSSGSSSGFNLTTTGSADWIHWGRGGVYGNLDRKAAGGGQISNATAIGSGANSGGWSDASRTVSWSDGTPTASAADHGYIWSNGALNSGFQFTAPADISSRTVIVYFGASNATCTLSAHLSDSSAADFSTTFSGPGAWFATLTYHAASAGQSLVLKLLKTGNNAGFTDGSADLDAAMLQSSSGGGGGVIGNGTGLTGQYFDNIDFSNLKITRTDATVDFDWGSGSPDPAIAPDTFSARWTGQVQASFSETYTFTTVSDDGIRLWVNGGLLIDNWTDHAPTENSGSIALSAGQMADVKLEFYENGGGAVAKLLWSSPSTPRQAVPQSQLYPTGGSSPPPPPPPSTNLARNPGFESDPSVDYFAYGSASFSWASDAAHGGSRSVKIVSVQAAGTLTRWLSRTTSIPAQAGASYAATAWFKASNVSDHGVLTINFWDANAGFLGGTDGGTIRGTADWTPLSVQASAPAGTAYVRIEFRLWGSGTLWTDDVTLTPQ